MNPPRCRRLHRLFFAGAVSSACLMARGQTPPGPAADLPPVPAFQPHTEMFRKLLAMPAAEQEQWLAGRTPQSRQLLEAKIHEYQAMNPETREAVLRATELHEYLQYFIMAPAADRSSQLAQIPGEYRGIVSNRLQVFTILPPDLQKEVLAGKTTAEYFLGPEPAAARVSKATYSPPPMPPEPVTYLSRLPAEQRQKMFASFQHFFDLDSDDRRKTLATLPPGERGQVERTLGALERLPAEEREQGLRSLSLLAGMTDEQREAFFRNAALWRVLPPAERQTWHKLVAHLPPMPPGADGLLTPPMPPEAASRSGLSAATNPSN
jgi:hypothetical protein